MAAFRSAVGSGISPVEFWQLTPYLTRVAVGGFHDGRAWSVWMTAALGRVKRMPKLADLQTGGKEKAGHQSNMNSLKSFLSGFKVKKGKR